jgi:3-phenylpropionate/cinnamic acid dioxygenase small subunit
VHTEPSATELATRTAVTDVIVSYAHAVDTRDWQLFRALFTDDARIDYTASYGIAGTPDEITAWIAKLMTYEAVPDTMHAITNVRVVAEGDNASATAYYVNPDVMAVGADEPYLMFNAGRYDLRMTRTGDGWKISSLAAEIMFSHRGDLMKYEIPE